MNRTKGWPCRHSLSAFTSTRRITYLAMVAFYPIARILEEWSTIHSPPDFFFFKWNFFSLCLSVGLIPLFTQLIPLSTRAALRATNSSLYARIGPRWLSELRRLCNIFNDSRIQQVQIKPGAFRYSSVFCLFLFSPVFFTTVVKNTCFSMRHENGVSTECSERSTN